MERLVGNEEYLHCKLIGKVNILNAYSDESDFFFRSMHENFFQTGCKA